jgi:divalent metal cation (Fe/Co/Zn/Cd) transporter
VHRGHALLEDVEARIRAAVPNVTVFTHLESLDDPSSWDDQNLDRGGAESSSRGEESRRP